MTEHGKKKVNDEMSECPSCGEYFGTSEECPLCGCGTVPISKGIEVFEDFNEESEEGLPVSSKLAYGEVGPTQDLSLDNDEYLVEAI